MLYVGFRFYNLKTLFGHVMVWSLHCQMFGLSVLSASPFLWAHSEAVPLLLPATRGYHMCRLCSWPFVFLQTEEEVVLSNDPQNDPRSQSGGIPRGHPSLDCFLGVPFKVNGKMIGMVGIANRPGGYTYDLVEALQPFGDLCSSFIMSFRCDTPPVMSSFAASLADLAALFSTLLPLTHGR
jgi:GAF domain-containing protein